MDRHDKALAGEFYNFGSGDEIRKLFWAQRRAQETGGVVENTPTLQRRYVNLPSPAYQDADGTLHEASVHAVEIVQLYSIVLSHGHKLFIVK